MSFYEFVSHANKAISHWKKKSREVIFCPFVSVKDTKERVVNKCQSDFFKTLNCGQARQNNMYNLYSYNKEKRQELNGEKALIDQLGIQSCDRMCTIFYRFEGHNKIDVRRVNAI